MCCVEKVLEECIVQEHKMIMQLHQFKAQQLQQIINRKDLGIGLINVLFNNYGLLQSSLPPITLPHWAQWLGSNGESGHHI